MTLDRRLMDASLFSERVVPTQGQNRARQMQKLRENWDTSIVRKRGLTDVWVNMQRIQVVPWTPQRPYEDTIKIVDKIWFSKAA